MAGRFALGICALLAIAGNACSSGAGDGGNERSSESQSGGMSGSSGASHTSTGSGAGMGDFGNANGDASVPSEPIEPGQLHVDCVGDTQHAERVQVDMYVMLDRSGSMLEDTGTGTNKWDAVRAALTDFVSDPASEGLGVGLQYFPLGAPGIPDMCLSDDDCTPDGGICTARACLPPRFGNAAFTTCLSDGDCPPNSPGCAPFGACSGDATLACFNFGAGGCADMGDCNPIPGECLFYASCISDDYRAPAVPIDVLPDNAMALTDSLTSEMPIGLTPTPSALEGALLQCMDQAAAFPDHRVIAVLATDGMPSDCVPVGTTTTAQAVQAVADIAANGLSARVPTYVIGVFAPEDPDAMQNLEQMAQAGGTEHAFVIDTSSDVSAEFLAALDAIRGGTLSCDLKLPVPPEDKEVDFNLVNVELTDQDGTRSLEYVETPDRCSESEVGWYYDTPPAQGTPTKISVCASTCDTLKAATNASVEIRLGCPPITPI